ncbi:MAG: hypothetical protein AAF797_15735 [Planctomycetota bacterium]
MKGAGRQRWMIAVGLAVLMLSLVWGSLAYPSRGEGAAEAGPGVSPEQPAGAAASPTLIPHACPDCGVTH